MFYLELSCFLYDSADVGNLISGSSAFSKSSLNIWNFSVHVLLKLGLYSSSVYSCYLLISSASVRSIIFLSLIVHIFAWKAPLVSLVFLKRSLVFPFYCFLLFLFIDPWRKPEEGFLISPCYSLELCIQMGISFLFTCAFSFSFYSALCKTSSDSHFAFLHFFSPLGMVWINASCTMSLISIHSSSGTLSDLVPWNICHLYNYKWFNLSNTWLA